MTCNFFSIDLLQVKFLGEEGVDEGGVQKEFFSLLLRQLLSPDYGMFTHDDDTRLHWFRPSSCLDLDTEFELAGILFGLAIYNAHNLEASFPRLLYKKLTQAAAAQQQQQDASTSAGACGSSSYGGYGGGISGAGAYFGGSGGASGSSRYPQSSSTGRPTASTAGPNHQRLGLDDLEELMPDTAAGLRKLLEMPAEVVDTLGLAFSAEMDAGFGEVEQVDLVPGGAAVPVTGSNRAQYVDAYVDHLLVGSIAKQFQPFQRGFHRLCR